MFWLHLKWLFWSINSIRPLFEALRRGQIFGQNYAWNHNLSADLFFFDIYMSLRAISLLKMPKHVTSSLQMTMSKNLSMDPQIFFLMVPKTDDGRKKRLENAFFKSVGNVHISTQMGLLAKVINATILFHFQVLVQIGSKCSGFLMIQ